MSPLQKRLAPDPKLSHFVRLIAQGDTPMDAAQTSGVPWHEATAYLSHPAIAAALTAALAQSWHYEIMPIAHKTALEIMKDDKVAPSVRARVAIEALKIAARPDEGNGSLANPNGNKKLSDMTPAELEAKAAELRSVLHEQERILEHGESILD